MPSPATRLALEKLARALHEYGEAQDAYDHNAHGVAANLHEAADQIVVALFRENSELKGLLPELAAEIAQHGRPFPASPFSHAEAVEKLLEP